MLRIVVATSSNARGLSCEHFILCVCVCCRLSAHKGYLHSNQTRGVKIGPGVPGFLWSWERRESSCLFQNWEELQVRENTHTHAHSCVHTLIFSQVVSLTRHRLRIGYTHLLPIRKSCRILQVSVQVCLSMYLYFSLISTSIGTSVGILWGPATSNVSFYLKNKRVKR